METNEKGILIGLITTIITSLFGLITTFITAGKEQYAIWILVISSVIGIALIFIFIFVRKNKKKEEISLIPDTEIKKEEQQSIYITPVVEDKRQSMLKHPLFQNCENWLFELRNRRCKTLKERVVILFLIFKIETIVYDIKEYLKRNLTDIENDGEIKEDFKEVILGCVKKYEEKSLSIGIPKIFIDKFAEYHQTALNVMIDEIDRTEISNFIFSDRYLKKWNKIDSVNNVLKYAFFDIDRIMLLNGDIDKALTDVRLSL